jgi:hypothetical protein
MILLVITKWKQKDQQAHPRLVTGNPGRSSVRQVVLKFVSAFAHGSSLLEVPHTWDLPTVVNAKACHYHACDTNDVGHIRYVLALISSKRSECLNR